jgi:hypothetical protein
LIVIAAAVAAFGSDEAGSAGRALRLRTQFTETSVRMIASAPVYGVGVGRYFTRSSEFMPDSLRELYGAENAHNYFAQQLAELGIVGGALFVWLVVAVLAAGWQQAREPGAPAVAGALLAGAAGYLLTCVTGHPFLVSAAALPFWIVAGAIAAPDAGVPQARRTTVAAIIAVALAANAAAGLLAYRRASAGPIPPERGFDRADVADDGRRFRWSSPHAVTYVPDGAGFLRLTLRAPDVEFERPMTAETAVAGRVVDRRALARGQWVTVEIPVRAEATAPFRRVDLRVVPYWTEKRPLGRRAAPVDIALGAMVGELRWVRPESR